MTGRSYSVPVLTGLARAIAVATLSISGATAWSAQFGPDPEADAALVLRMAPVITTRWSLPATAAPAPAISRPLSPSNDEAVQAEPQVANMNLEALVAPASASCRQLTPDALTQLLLMDAVAHALCSSPPINQALLLVDEQQAALSLARSAFRPRLVANAELATNRVPLSNNGVGSLSASGTGSLGLTWVLFDAGARDASLERSRQLLTAARAGRQTVVLNTANEALRLYIEAASASTRLDALQETETVARQSLQVAQAKHNAQVSSLADKLQASTALAQATLDRVRAEGTWTTARGLLAVGMGFPADQRLTLAPIQQAFQSLDSGKSWPQWMTLAKQQHPRFRSAGAEVQALRSRLDAIRAEGRGSVALSVGVGSTRDLGAAGARFDNRVSGYVIASIPLFNQAEQQAREREVIAQIEGREIAVVQIEREIESELWRSAQLLASESQSLDAAEKLLVSATQSYQITLGRYKAGVGSILEVMGTQASLSLSRAQLAQSVLGVVQARLRLEAASGRMFLK